MKKNAEWAKQLTEKQLEQFEDNIRAWSCSGATFDEYMLRSSESFYDFIQYSFEWRKTETPENGFTQGSIYWHHIAEEKSPLKLASYQDIDKIRIGLHPEQERFIIRANTPAQVSEKMRDEIALEAMKSRLGDVPLPLGYYARFAEECYGIADAMLEARKLKTETS